MKISKYSLVPRNYSIQWNLIKTNNFYSFNLVGHDVIDATSKVKSEESVTSIKNTVEEISTEPLEKKIVYRRNYSLDDHGKISFN